jgi:hypothetical protein
MGLKITMGYTKFVIVKDLRSQPPDSPEDEREFIRGQTKCRLSKTTVIPMLCPCKI